jgi:hypothetical protein
LGFEFTPSRRSNSKHWDYIRHNHHEQLIRKRIETAFKQGMFPKYIRAVTLDSFSLKVSMFVIAFALDESFIWQLGLITSNNYSMQ